MKLGLAMFWLVSTEQSFSWFATSDACISFASRCLLLLTDIAVSSVAWLKDAASDQHGSRLRAGAARYVKRAACCMHCAMHCGFRCLAACPRAGLRALFEQVVLCLLARLRTCYD
jgi:hypothetical protein